jgi:hypothetical protein
LLCLNWVSGQANFQTIDKYYTSDAQKFPNTHYEDIIN